MNIYSRALNIEFDYNGVNQIITPAMIRDERHTFLVDCGYPGFISNIDKALNQEGTSLSSLTGLILTHHDLDHVGSLAEIKRKFPHIRIIAHEQEAQYIEGKCTAPRLQQALDSLNHLPTQEQPAAKEFIRVLESLESAPVNQTVQDQEQLPWCQGMEIVHTPGHTPGHISIYLEASRTLIAGDAVVIEANGELGIANPQYTLDLAQAVRSVQRLVDYEIDTLICYHGGIFSGEVRPALQRLLRSYTLQ